MKKESNTTTYSTGIAEKPLDLCTLDELKELVADLFAGDASKDIYDRTAKYVACLVSSSEAQLREELERIYLAFCLLSHFCRQLVDVWNSRQELLRKAEAGNEIVDALRNLYIDDGDAN